ncbi:MAG: hypothetical protein JF615_03935 [Asticcacaulis sp.]|nr:hypothetical protein [Asticcacaulis sp.]
MKTMFAAATLFLATTCPAFAAESMFVARPADSNCEAPQETKPFRLWKPGDGVMRFAGSGDEVFEFYGHGIDLSPDAEITGITGSDGVRAKAELIDHRVGAVNAAHGCGNIGSVTVKITMPPVTSANSGTLRIGSERFDVRAVPIVAVDADWNGDNGSDGPQPTQAEMQAHDAALLQSAINICQQKVITGPRQGQSRVVCTLNGYFSPVTLNQACTAFRNMGAICDTTHSYAVQTHHDGFIATIGNCGDSFGVTSLRNAGTVPTLTITLPAERTGAVADCFVKPVVADYDHGATGTVVWIFGRTSVAHTMSQTATAGAPTFTFSDAGDGFDGRIGRIFFTRAGLQNLVGTYVYDLTVTPASDSSKLRLVLQSRPGFAVNAITVPAYGGSGRLNSSYFLRVTPLQKTLANQTFHWEIAGQAADAPCFTASRGDVTPAPNLASFDILLTITENAGCFARTLTARVVPDGAGADDMRFSKTLAFAVPKKLAIVAPTTPTTLKPNLP